MFLAQKLVLVKHHQKALSAHKEARMPCRRWRPTLQCLQLVRRAHGCLLASMFLPKPVRGGAGLPPAVVPALPENHLSHCSLSASKSPEHVSQSHALLQNGHVFLCLPCQGQAHVGLNRCQCYRVCSSMPVH